MAADEGKRFDLEHWMQQHGIKCKERQPYEDGLRWLLKACPFHESHTGTSAALFRRANGALGFKCQHASCAGKTWRDVREKLEPVMHYRP